ncbi:hypothetical protein AB0M87_14460 [Streptomyces sp. NPDC051320]|uniref:hypothetical protein n=1 Tax=Streptomyces sp. NPDC051320 TaxID=3154644 RepID=UPI00341815A4
MNDPERVPPPMNQPYGGYPPSGGMPRPAPIRDYDYPPSGPAPAPRRDRRRDGSGTRRTALFIQTLGDVAAVFLGLWILLYLLDANRSNPFVGFVQGVADWLGWWAQDIFTMDVESLRVLLNYGLPAVIYLLIGHGIATWMRRASDA